MLIPIWTAKVVLFHDIRKFLSKKNAVNGFFLTAERTILDFED